MKRRLARIRFTLVLSLIVLATIITLWARRERHADLVAFYGPAGTLQGIASDPKGLLLFFSDLPFGRESRFSANAASISAGEFASVHEWLFDPTREQWNHLGFRCASGTINLNGSVTCKYTSLIVPYWLPAILASILPLAFVRRRWTRWRRLRTGCCLQCGYDIRYSPNRCPECGTSMTDKPAPRKAAAATEMLPWVLTGVLAAAIAIAFIRGAEGGASEVGTNSSSKTRPKGDVESDAMSVRVYPIGDLYGDPIVAPTQSTAPKSADRLIELLTLVYSGAPYSTGVASMSAVADRLAVYQTRQGHAAVRTMLAALRSETYAAATPATQPPGEPSLANLDQQIDEVKIESLTLDQSIDLLREKTHANLVVLWGNEMESSFRRNIKIKLHLWDVTLGQALKVICALALNSDGSEMSYDVLEDVIRIGTPDTLRREGGLVTRLYDIRDIIDDIVRFQFAHSPPGPPPARVSNFNDQTAVDEAVESIVRVLEDTVSPDSWKDNGGADGSVRALAGRLVIAQTAANHREVIRVLRVLRSVGAKEGAPLDPSR
jgi:hypothetical protein